MYSHTKFGMDRADSFVAPNLPKELKQQRSQHRRSGECNIARNVPRIVRLKMYMVQRIINKRMLVEFNHLHTKDNLEQTAC